MALTRWVGWVRDVVRVLRGVSSEEIRKETLAMHEQLIRLRRHRAAHEKEREVAALNDIRKIVEEMKNLETRLNEAEKATTEYVDAIGKQVTVQMEAEINAEAEEILSKVKMQSGNMNLTEVAISKLAGSSFEIFTEQSKQFLVSESDGGATIGQNSRPYEPPPSSESGVSR